MSINVGLYVVSTMLQIYHQLNTILNLQKVSCMSTSLRYLASWHC